MASGSVRRSADRTPLQLECLEERIAPAGNIVWVVRGGNLTITGDEEGNSFWLDDMGLGPDQLCITPQDGTTIGGVAHPVVVSGVTRGITMKLGDGDDHVVLQGIDVARNVRIDTGAGASNSVEVDSSTVIGRSLIISNRAGGANNTVNVGAEVGGNVLINIRQDNKSTCTFNGADIDGRVNVAIKKGTDWLGGGGSSLSILNSEVGGVNVKVGSGDYDFSFVGSHTVQGKGGIRLSYGLGDITTLIDDSTVYGPVSVKTGSRSWFGGLIGMADDTAFTLQNDSNIYGRLTIANSTSDDVVTVSEATVTKGVGIKNGTGESTVAINNAWIGTHPTLQKVYASTISNMGSSWGSPDDTTSISVYHATFGGLRLLLRPQASDVSFAIVEIGRSLSVNSKSGDDQITMSHVGVGGNTAIRTAGGNDLIGFDHVSLDRALLISTGAGDDQVKMDSWMFALPSEYSGRVRVMMGAGDDYLQMGNPSASGNEGEYSKPVVLNGGRGTDELFYLDNGNTFAVDPKPISFENVH